MTKPDELLTYALAFTIATVGVGFLIVAVGVAIAIVREVAA